jgi:hypothetical protein
MMPFGRSFKRIKGIGTRLECGRAGICISFGLGLPIEFCGHKTGDWKQLRLFVKCKRLLTVEVDGKGRNPKDCTVASATNKPSFDVRIILGRLILISF